MQRNNRNNFRARHHANGARPDMRDDRNDQQLQTGKPHRLSNFIGPQQLKVIESYFPEYRFIQRRNRSILENPIYQTTKLLVEKHVFNLVKGNLRNNNILLDVGANTSIIRAGPQVSDNMHGIVHQKGIHKLIVLEDLVGIEVDDATMRTNARSMTYCLHDIGSCNCVNNYSAFISSFNQLNNEQISILVDESVSKTGYIIDWNFNGNSGEFDKEFYWYKDGSLRLVKNQLTGDTRVCKPIKSSFQLNGYTYVFRRILTKGNVNLYKIYRINSNEHVDPFIFVKEEKFDSQKLSSVSYVRNNKLKDKFFTFKKNAITVKHVALDCEFPIKMVEDLTRYLIPKSFDEKTWEETLKRASLLTRKNRYTGFERADLLDAIPSVVLYATLRKCNMTDTLSESISPELDASKQMHNTMLAYRYPFFPWRHHIINIILIMLFSTITILCFWLMWDPLIDYFWSFSVPVVVATVILTSFSMFSLNTRLTSVKAMFMYYLGTSKVCYSYSGLYEVNNSVKVIYIISMYIIIKLMYELYKRIPKLKYRNWEIWLNNYKLERISTPINASIPKDAVINSVDSWVKEEEYPQRPEVRFFVMEEDNILEYEEQKPGVRPIGLCFTAAVPLVHATTQHNTKLAIKSRVTLDLGMNEDKLRPIWRDHCQRLNGYLPLMRGDDYGPMPIDSINSLGEAYIQPTFDDWISRYTPTKAKALFKQIEKFEIEGYETMHLHYNAFVKREKILCVTTEEFQPKKPRVIQGASQVEKTATGLWFYRYSKAMKHVWHYKHFIWVASGATSEEYNRWFMYQTKRLGGVDNCVFVGTDFSTYDVTQGEACKHEEHEWYRKLGFVEDLDDEFDLSIGEEILRKREKVTVYTNNGIKVKYNARRQSGSSDTTVGNNRNTAMAILGACLWAGLLTTEFAIAVIGDDNYLIVLFTAWVMAPRNFIETYCEKLGFKLKIQVSLNPTAVEFVSCRFFPVKSGYAIGKKPGRVLCKMGWMLYKPNRSYEMWESLLKASLLSYASTGLHVPFLRVYLNEMYKRLKHVDAKFEDEDLKYKMMGKETYVANSSTFDVFEEVYGLTHRDEIKFAEKLRNVELPYLLDCGYVKQLFEIDSQM